MANNGKQIEKTNNPFHRPWRLEMSIVVAPLNFDGGVINMLHCFAPHPLRVDVSKDRLLAARGDGK